MNRTAVDIQHDVIAVIFILMYHVLLILPITFLLIVNVE